MSQPQPSASHRRDELQPCHVQRISRSTRGGIVGRSVLGENRVTDSFARPPVLHVPPLHRCVGARSVGKDNTFAPRDRCTVVNAPMAPAAQLTGSCLSHDHSALALLHGTQTPFVLAHPRASLFSARNFPCLLWHCRALTNADAAGWRPTGSRLLD